MLTYLISSFIVDVGMLSLLTKLKCQMRILPPLPRLERERERDEEGEEEEVSYSVFSLSLCVFPPYSLSFVYLSILLFDVFVVFRFDLSALLSTYVCNESRG